MTPPRPCERVVAGTGTAIVGAHAELSFRVAGLARALGFTGIRVVMSRVPGSNSRYVYATDARGRSWKLRLSNHRRPDDAPVPHFELISCDGRAGFDAAAAFLRRVAAGEVAWFDDALTGRMISRHQRQLWGRR